MRELILGIDEAGKGPVMGPMVIAGCLIEKEDESFLRKLGVKDSKMVTQKRREFLEKEIKKIAKAFELIVCEAEEIDKKSSDGTKLTELEAEKIAQIITKLTPEEEKLKVIIDCPSFGIGNWKNVLRIKLKNLGNIELVVEHKADKNHLSVGAASILAKCERERKMTELKEKYGDEIGSGYCMDPLTKRFVEKFAIKFKDDGLFRKSWSTWKIAYTKLKQIELEF